MSEAVGSAKPEGRAAHVISQLYYYVAAAIGVGFVIGGSIAILFGVRTLILPDEFQQARDGVRALLFGLSFIIPGLLVMWWHLREARRLERRGSRGGFWGAALYFHLVALLALGFVLGGSAMTLAATAEVVVPPCYTAETHATKLSQGDRPDSEMVLEGGRLCGGADARNIVDAAIFVIAAGPIMWWHLRQGRRLTAPPPETETS